MESQDERAEALVVIRAQARDESAFSELVGRYHNRLLYYVRRLLHNDAKADDVMQEAWLNAWRQLPGLRSPRAFGVWIYRIARNRAVQHVREAVREEEALDDWSGQEEITDAAFEEQEIARLFIALEQLPTLQREALVLRFLEGMTYEEMAEVVGCAVGTVRSRLHYGKQMLRKILEEKSHVG